jgi:AcrR family transcriptional regulator
LKNTKENIVAKSLGLFLTKSYRDVTMSEILNRTGLSKGGFYHYFSSKEDLFKEILNLFIQFGSADYNNFDRTSLKQFYTSYTTSITGALQKISSFVSSDSTENLSLNFFFIMFEAASRVPEFLLMEKEIYKRDLAEWISMIENARQNGEIESSASNEEIAKLFLYCTDGVFVRFVNNIQEATYQDELQKAFDTIYDGIRK